MPTECIAVCPRRLQLAKARRSLPEALSRGIRRAGWSVAGKCRCPAGVVGRRGHDRKPRVPRRLAAEIVSDSNRADASDGTWQLQTACADALCPRADG